ncbi:MAG: thiamine monophosphate synthase [Pelagibacteraceae bacterium]|nr:MAG: thiamine monophosphate synthase [Pelagibacteraceae bacterium]
MTCLNYTDRFFFFTDKLNSIIEKNINKFKNLSIVYKADKNNINIKEFLKIKDFCKKKKIKIYFSDNIKTAIKLGADGLFISSTNRRVYQPYKKSFKIIGSAHSQKEFYFKSKQRCHVIFLSPIFDNPKYTTNKILGIIKFNLISLYWKNNLVALGGINENNYKKILLTKSYAIGLISWIKNLEIKKPVYFFNNTRAFINNI